MLLRGSHQPGRAARGSGLGPRPIGGGRLARAKPETRGWQMETVPPIQFSPFSPLSPSSLLALSRGDYFQQVCGKRRVKERAPSNETTWEGKWPWQVSVQYGKHYLCQGTLIDLQWVLTASHCFHIVNEPAAYYVIIGNYKLHEISPRSVRIGVKMIFRHPYLKNTQPFAHDVALLFLKVPVKLSPYIMPICLPESDLKFEKKVCLMTGWERTVGTVSLAKTFSLQEVQLPFIKNSECNALYASMENSTSNTTLYEIKDEMLCAGDLNNPKVICLGDIGSPLVCEFSNIWMQMGLVSWSTPCSPTYLTVFTRLAPYLDWIEKIKRIAFLETWAVRKKTEKVGNLAWTLSGPPSCFPIFLVPLQIMFLHHSFCLDLLMAP
ncbi:serine protease 27-like isoform X1 [Sarcophilus harrisii]|uniref:serine protease 27-like isoform X1 n=1 Tax=Sarcophilus harrisii TaxID=9305 RepID=UPI001301FE6E|nr:serine protease 27-like isoform X1 [Sarcophilus harrisii]